VSYRNAFIKVASDCPAERGVAPVAKGGTKSIPVIQYELLAANPYRFTHEELIFEVFVRHKAIPPEEVERRGAALREELFRKSHPCMRASPLAKTYGWGVHHDQEGRIAIYGMESDTYWAFVDLAAGAGLTLLPAMRNKRA